MSQNLRQQRHNQWTSVAQTLGQTTVPTRSVSRTATINAPGKYSTATYVAGTTISLIVATHGLLDLNEHGTENASV